MTNAAIPIPGLAPHGDRSVSSGHPATGDGSDRGVRRVPWAYHYRRMDETVRPGQHFSIIAPTGGGKSHLVRHGILPLFRYSRVMVIDPTEDDVNFGEPFVKVNGFPGRLQRVNRDPEWYRYIPPMHDRAAARARVGEILVRCNAEREWVLVCDETKKVTSANDPNYGLAGDWEEIMLRARKRRVTMINATQAPRWIPGAMYDQPTHIYLGAIRDKRSRLRLQEISGAETEDIAYGLTQLREHEYLYVGPGRMEIVKAPG